jgi:N-acetylneuraminic acid mutarotase/ribosomal protein S11
MMRWIAAGVLCSASLMLAACGGDSISGGTGSTPITVGGTVTGLATGASVELQNNGSNTATVTANGSYTFTSALINGASYDVTISQQPAGENCAVSNGTGTVGATRVANILVTCTPDNYTIGGSLAGLLSGRTLVLQDNGGNSTTLSASGSFRFSTPVPSGANYAVTIMSKPVGQSCAVTNGSGTLAAANITNVSISCSDDTYNVGVTVSGVNASGLRLQDNSADALSVATNGNFNFNTPVASGSPYAVTISSQPLGETCIVANGSGTIISANVSNVTVSCIPNLYPISGSLTGLLSGHSLILQDNGTNSTTVSGNGAFGFLTSVASGSNYSVTVFTPPVGQTCAVTNGSGAVAGSAVSNVGIACSDNTYNVGVAVSGVIRSGLILQDNGGDNLTVSANGSFNFATPVPSGSNYAVTLLTQPAGESCAVTNGSGTVVASNIMGIPVGCTPISYSIGGALTGLLPNNSLVLQDNSGNDTTLSANGNFTFSGQIASGSAYAVTVSNQPPGQNCTVSNGSGTVVSSNVITVGIACSDNSYNIGVTVSGVLSGTSLVLQDNGGDNLTVSTNGSSNFPTPIASGSGYSVAILSPALGENCTLTSGSGTVGSSNVSVTVSCTPNNYIISGAVSGLLSGNSLVLQDNGGDNTTVSANTGFSFPTSVPSGSTYSVTVSTQPSGQTCAVSNSSGTVAGANISNVTVTCSDNTYDIGVTVSGLNASGLVLQDNGGDNLSISASGTFSFPTPIASGSTYAVTVLSQPIGQSCTVTSASGTVTSSNVTGIPVSCVNTYTIGGSVSGFVSGSLVLQDNGVDDLTISANGNFTFATPIASGAAYAVTISTQPQGQTCSITTGSGTVSVADVTNVSVICSGAWTWVAGSSTYNASSLYGTQGMAAASNVPGARNYSISWTDGAGNLWLFGGYGYGTNGYVFYLNDLWMYNPSAQLWTWVGGSNPNGSQASPASGFYGTQGTAGAGNIPGARELSVSWTDHTGNLWLLGGIGYDVNDNLGYLNDLWMYSPSTNLWTWVRGANNSGNHVVFGVYGTQGTAATSNEPGTRAGAISWTDSAGNLWMFGGQGWGASGSQNSELNDLWMYSPSMNLWTWMSGSNQISASGVYGAQGTAAASNVPGARADSTSWADSAGNLWLFGGYGYDANGTLGYLNDLWMYSPSTNQWTWVSGSSTVDAAGVYGTQGMAMLGNTPGARLTSVSSTDSAGNLWLFGGSGYDANGNQGVVNDLWVYSPSTNLWTWVGGSNTRNAPGVYGTLGIAAQGNVPGSRDFSLSWTDRAGHFWVFGGDGYDVNGNGGYLNDLWEYIQ